MPTKRNVCQSCRTHTIVRKVAFKGTYGEEPSYAWLCSVCVDVIRDNEEPQPGNQN